MQLIIDFLIISFNNGGTRSSYYIVMGAVGIAATLFVCHVILENKYKSSIDIETKILSDLDETITGLIELTIKDPPIIFC